MAKELKDTVEGAQAQVLERHLASVQAEIVESFVAELPTPAAPVDAGTTSPMPGGLEDACGCGGPSLRWTFPDDADTHGKALRFARLLVDEIRLYNQARPPQQGFVRSPEAGRKTWRRVAARARSARAAAVATIWWRLFEDDLSVVGASFKG